MVCVRTCCWSIIISLSHPPLLSLSPSPIPTPLSLLSPASYDVVKGVLVSLDFIVLGFCVISLVLTAKTLRRAYRLGKAMGQFYHKHLNLPLSWWERRSLFSPWHYFNITSDFLISSGTLYKILLEFEVCMQ